MLRDSKSTSSIPWTIFIYTSSITEFIIYFITFPSDVRIIIVFFTWSDDSDGFPDSPVSLVSAYLNNCRICRTTSLNFISLCTYFGHRISKSYWHCWSSDYSVLQTNWTAKVRHNVFRLKFYRHSGSRFCL